MGQTRSLKGFRGTSALPLIATRSRTFPERILRRAYEQAVLSLPWRSEKFLAVGETVGLEEEAKQHRAIRRDRLVLIAGVER